LTAALAGSVPVTTSAECGVLLICTVLSEALYERE